VWRIAPSSIQGLGVHVIHFIPAGTSLGIAQALDRDGRTWRVTPLGRYHNHSTSPSARNVRVGNQRYLVAARDLYPGEEVTIDYRLQPDLEQPRAGWS